MSSHRLAGSLRMASEAHPGSGPEGNAEAPNPLNTLAVMVTYHPDDETPARVAAARVHAGRLLVVDNTPGEVPGVLERLGAMPGVDVCRMGHNAGIAAALNRGLAEAGAYAWVLLLDQDTMLWPVYGDVVRRVVSAAHPSVGLVGVNFVNDASGVPHVEPALGHRAVPYVVSSGTMLSAACAQQIGGFCDDYFIDYVDIEYGLRARRHGYAVVLASELAMDHGMAEVATRRVLGYTRQTSNYRVARHYYMARNSLVTMRAYGATEGRWLRREFAGRAKLIALTLAMEPGRLRTLASIARGTIDGLRKRMGEAPASLSERAAR